MIIKISNNENFIFTFSPDYCEFIDINNPEKFSFTKSENFLFYNPKNKASFRNKMILLKNNNYLLSIIGRKTDYLVLYGSFIYIYIFNYNSDNINGYSIIKGNREGIITDFLNTTECFQTEKQFIECIINERSNPITNVLKIFIYDLDIKELAREYIAEINENTFNKIIYLKNEIGAYIYFDKNTPLIQIKYLENNKLIYQFENSPIKLNGNGAYSLNNNIFLSDAIKINDYKFSLIFTSKDLFNILICLFEIYNNDKSYYLQYFYLELNKLNIKIALNIKTFLFREHIGIALYNSNNKYSGFLIFNYPNLTNKEIILFNEDSINNFSLAENLIISNNILGHELQGVYIINFNDTEISGVLLFSNKKNDYIHTNDRLNMDDTIIFKPYNNISFPGVYNLDLIPIIKEPNFNKLESLSEQKKYYGEPYEHFYNAKEFRGKLIILEYIVEEKCYYVYHKDRFNKRKICYEGIDEHCIYEEYKYFIDDKKQCVYGQCPMEYYQLNFECFKEGCPLKSIQLSESNIYISEDKYFIVNEHYKTKSSNTKFHEYKYNFNNTNQYLRYCNESMKYTTLGIKTYLYNEVCLINCPENTIKDEENEKCSCKYYKYNIDENNYICFSELELCKDKILVNDIRECEDSIIFA